MLNYDVTVSTADVAAATTFSNVFIKLVGEDGESERTWLVSIKGAAAFIKGAVSLRFYTWTTCLCVCIIYTHTNTLFGLCTHTFICIKIIKISSYI